jgi:hypothetical protein
MRRAALALILVAFVTGCGEDDEPAPSGPVTKAEYEERYRAVSENNDAKRDELRETFESAEPEETDKVARGLREFASAMDEDRNALDALEPPADIAKEHQGYVDVLAETVIAYREAAQEIDDAGSPEEARVAGLARLAEHFEQEDNQRAAEAFVAAIEKGDYDLGVDVKKDVLPEAGAAP